jgi:hypothetical protein
MSELDFEGILIPEAEEAKIKELIVLPCDSFPS